jgi:hypothetical protein
VIIILSSKRKCNGCGRYVEVVDKVTDKSGNIIDI